MKHKVFLLILGFEAALCLALNILPADFSGGLAGAMAFPFAQIGLLLRTLSLSGALGNLAAICIYVAVSLIPAVILLMLMKRRKLYLEDGLLILMSALLFTVLYLMINPGDISSLLGKAMGLAVGKSILGASVYSVVCCYLVLRILRLFFGSGTERLQKYMTDLLYLLNMFFVYLVFGACFSHLLKDITVLRSGNTGNEHLLGMTEVFLAVQYMVDALPYLFDVLVVFAAQRLLRERGANRDSNESVQSAVQLSQLCRIALAVTVLTNVAFNLLQLLFARRLMVISSAVQIPFLSIVFVLAVLLLARFIAENKKLKDDNNLFI